MIFLVTSIIIAYLLGSIPTGYILGKVLKGIDIRKVGSGNVGATNVFRTVGKLPGLVVFFLDALKGFLAVAVVPILVYKVFPDEKMASYTFVPIVLSFSVIGGHIWTCFLQFKGGKGVATTAGVMFGLAPGIFVTCLIIWIIVFSVWKYVSLASISAAVALPLVAAITNKSLDFIIFCSLLCIIGVFSHRSNIKRLIQGKENKIVKVQKS